MITRDPTPSAPRSAVRFAARSLCPAQGLSACLVGLLSGCSFLSLSNVPSGGSVDGKAYWEGYVYVYPFDGSELIPLDEGTLMAVDLDGAELAAAEQPYDTAPSWYRLQLRTGVEVGLRIEGGDGAPTLWHGRVPEGNAIWLGGTVFAFNEVDMDGFLADLADHGATGDEVPALLVDASVAHLWGTPLDAEVAAALLTAEMEVVDGNGDLHPVYRLATGRQGNLVEVTSLSAAPAGVEVFVAVNLPPGPATLLTTTADGRQVETTWPAAAGDVLSAAFYALPEGS